MHSALAQAGTKLLRACTGYFYVHVLSVCKIVLEGIQKKSKRHQKTGEEKRERGAERERGRERERE